MNIIQQFLHKEKREYINNRDYYGEAVLIKMFDNLMHDANLDKQNSDTLSTGFIYASPKRNVQQLIDGYGVILSYHDADRIINRPTCIKKVGDEQQVGCESAPIKRFDENQSYLGDQFGKYGNLNNQYSYVYDFKIDTENDRMYIACRNVHTIKAFTYSTGKHLWTYGIQSQAGNLADGKLYLPTSVEILPNGNVLGSSQYGTGFNEDGNGINNGGSVFEIDSTDGSLIKCHLMHESNGNAQNMECYRPFKLSIIDNQLYISMPDKGHVGVFDITKDSNLEYVTAYTKPRGVDLERAYPVDVVKFSDDKLLIANSSPDIIAAIGIDDHDYKQHIGRTDQDDMNNPENKLGSFYNIYNIFVVDENSMLVVDYGNNRISKEPLLPFLDIEFDVTIPEGFKIVDDWAIKNRYNVNTHIIRYPIYQFNDIGSIYIPIEKILD